MSEFPSANSFLRSAREHLSFVLGDLQSSVQMSTAFEPLAESVANAMGSVHKMNTGPSIDMNQYNLAVRWVTRSLELLTQLPYFSTKDLLVRSITSALADLERIVPKSELKRSNTAIIPTVKKEQNVVATSTQIIPSIHAPAETVEQINITVELSASSSSNFYRGLGGNDVVEYGGLFVATYQSPQVGTPLNLKIDLPGSYSFEASAVVRWIRVPEDLVDTTEPGFGAKFTRISTEARQLVHRFVRNREPLFFED